MGKMSDVCWNEWTTVLERVPLLCWSDRVRFPKRDGDWRNSAALRGRETCSTVAETALLPSMLDSSPTLP